MSTELIIILELIAVLVIVLLVSVVVWLREVNQALMSQLEQMQGVLDGKNETHEKVAESFQDLDDELDEQVTTTLDNANANLGDMEKLVIEHRGILTELDGFLSQSDPDVGSARLEIDKLKALLATTEKGILEYKARLNKSETSVKSLKGNMRELSKQILTMNSLEVSEGRLKRDKTRLMDRMSKLEDKYENEKVLAKNLENELKTSFKAGEVQAMKDDLRNTEEQLKRTMIEKAFIEQHFLELANNADPEELDRELKRVKREMRQLEKGILDSD